MSSQLNITDLESRTHLSRNLSQLDGRRKSVLEKYENLSLAQMNYTNAKWSAITNLSDSLSVFEKKFTTDDRKILWARNKEDVFDALDEIIELSAAENFAISEGKETYECNVRAHLYNKNLAFIETNLGQQILDLVEEDAAHPFYPSLSKSKSELKTIVENKSDSSITEFKRKQKAFLAEPKKLAIFSPDHLIANEGLIAYSDEEGFKNSLAQSAETLVFIGGINRVLRSISDYASMIRLEACMQRGTDLAGTQNLLRGNTRQKVYVILLDNGRSSLLKNREFQSLLYDNDGISMLCQNEVFLRGANSEGATAFYDHPSELKAQIGSEKMEPKLLYATRGAMDDERALTTIDYSQSVSILRKKYVLEKKSGFFSKTFRQLWQKVLLDRSLMNAAGFSIKKKLLNRLFNSQWKKHRAVPVQARKTFNQLWQEMPNSF